MHVVQAVLMSYVVFGGAGVSRAQDIQQQMIKVGPDFGINFAWFDDVICGEPRSAKLHFKVGDRTLSFDRKHMRRGILKYPSVQQKPGQQPAAVLARRSGCSDKPLPLVHVELGTNLTELPASVVITETPDRAEPLSPAAKYIEFLRGKGECEATAKPQIITCSGSRTVNDTKVAIIFFVLVDDSGKVKLLDTGLPIYARCEEFQNNLSCYIEAETSGKIIIKGAVNALAMSADTLRKKYEALVGFGDAIAAPASR